MKRGLVVYLENSRDLLIQFGCLYTSLKYIDSKDTDLIVFGTKEALEKVPDDCVKIICNPLEDPPVFKYYRYMNSINCLISEGSEILDQYDFLLRSDLDTFLSPAWNSFYPDKYTVGHGAYVNDNNTVDNLYRIASLFNLNHRGIHNIGSTHYGKPSEMKEVAKLTIKLCEYILAEEFKDNQGEWPGWYRGVSLLYGTEIAVNHLIDNLDVDRQRLDSISTSRNSVLSQPHIHCWHTDDVFSKFQFLYGTYDQVDINSLDVNIVSDYCLFIALKSRKELPNLG